MHVFYLVLLEYTVQQGDQFIGARLIFSGQQIVPHEHTTMPELNS